jgi:uncharacterized protein (UPF0332 family)
MSLDNLVKTGQLKPHETTAAELQRMLAAAKRNLTDAQRAANSAETRFDCAYKAIMQCALAAMMAAGYRPSTNQPGHHQTLLQSLPLTLGLTNDEWIVLDALRKKRNQADYTGAPVSAAEVAEAVTKAALMVTRLQKRLEER